MTCQRSNPCAFYENPVDTACNCAGNCTPATPSPFYASSVGCQEEQVKTVIQNQYATGLTTSVSFNIPACGESVQVTFPGLQLVNIGSYLWNPTYGYLKITSFDIASATVTVQNECQDGNAAAGTEVPSCTVFTVTDNPIGIDNPCTNAVVEQGALVVCKNGVMQPLDATSPGQVPVSQDAGTNEVKFETIDLQVLNCTPLTAILTLLPGNTGPYIFNVDDSSIFVSGDVVLISGTNHRFLVATVPNGLQFTANLITPATTSIESHSTGENICMAGCCDQIGQQIDALDISVTNQFAALEAKLSCSSQSSNVDIIVPLTWAAPTFDWGPTGEVVIVNNSSLSMLAIVDVTAVFAFKFGVSEPDIAQLYFQGFSGAAFQNIGDITPVVPAGAYRQIVETYNIAVTNSYAHKEFHLQYLYTIPTAKQLRFSALCGIQWVVAGGGHVTDIAILKMNTMLTGFGVAV